MNEGWNCQSFPPNYCVICDYVYQHIDLLQDPRVEDNAALNICDVVPLLNDNDIRIFFFLSLHCLQIYREVTGPLIIVMGHTNRTNIQFWPKHITQLLF